MFYAVRKGNLAKKIAEIVSENKQPQPNLIIHKIMATQFRPLHRILAFLDPLLGRPAAIVKLDNTFATFE